MSKIDIGSPEAQALSEALQSATRCETCRWWDRLAQEHTYADCRRMPPLNTLSVSGKELGGGRVQVIMDTHRAASWPNTAHDDWCGEHRPRA